MSLFGNSLAGTDLRADSEEAVYEALCRHYQILLVRKANFGNDYKVHLKDGSIKTVSVKKCCNLFGEERIRITYIS